MKEVLDEHNSITTTEKNLPIKMDNPDLIAIIYPPKT